MPADRKKKWRDANKGRIADYQRAKLRGWPEGLFELTCLAQGGRCAICKEARKLCADHDHTTGKPRAALCRSCNARVGVYESQLLRIETENYIQSWKDSHGQK